MIELFDMILGESGIYLALCDECQQSRPFRSERERELWQRNHAHQQDPS